MKALIARTHLNKESIEGKSYDQLEKLLQAIQKVTMSPLAIEAIYEHIDRINSTTSEGKILLKAIKDTESNIIKIAVKENVVPINYYRKLWMPLGMSAFGIPMGVVFGLSLKNMAFIGIGLPIGMALGLAFGTVKDQKALAEGRQLDFEAK